MCLRGPQLWLSQPRNRKNSKGSETKTSTSGISNLTSPLNGHFRSVNSQRNSSVFKITIFFFLRQRNLANISSARRSKSTLTVMNRIYRTRSCLDEKGTSSLCSPFYLSNDKKNIKFHLRVIPQNISSVCLKTIQVIKDMKDLRNCHGLRGFWGDMMTEGHVVPYVRCWNRKSSWGENWGKINKLWILVHDNILILAH